MRRVVVYELLALNGVAEDPDQFFASWDEATDVHLASVIATQDAVILGRRSFDEWADYWPSSDMQPFSSFINDVPKYVATTTPLGREWANTTPIDGDLFDFVRRLKDQPGGDIGVHASISVAATLLAAGLVDKLSLVIAPAVAARGQRLLDRLPAIELELHSSTSTPSGHLLLDYRVMAEPPATGPRSRIERTATGERQPVR